MSARIIDSSPLSVTKFHDHGDGKFTIAKTQDVEAVVEDAKARHNLGATRTGMGDRHAMRVPIIVIDAWARARGLTYGEVMRDPALLKAFVEDPENGDFRIWKGAL